MDNTVIMLALHVIVCALYSGFWFSKNKEEGIYRLIVVLFMPFAGFAYLVLGDILSCKSSGGKDKLFILQGAEKGLRENYVKVDFEREVNIIPIEEALAINSKSIKRELLVSSYKEDADKYIEYLKKALKDEDTQISHYAAVTIMEVKRRLAVTLQDLTVKYEENKNDLVTARLYADILKRYLESGFLGGRTYIKYRYIYLSVLRNILEIDDSEEAYYIDKINCDLELGDYAKANEYCKRFKKRHPDSEMPYIMNMKLFYILRDYKKFNRVVSLLKESDIKFTNKALNIVRFWSGVGSL